MRDGEEPAAEPVIELGGYDPDKVRHHGAPARRGVTWAVAVVALLVGGLGGYLVGVQRSAAAPPAAAHSEGASAAPAPVTATGGMCFHQNGTTLVLGVELSNSSGAGVTLNRIDVLLPLDGLKAVSSAWGNCDTATAADGNTPFSLDVGATTWIRETFEVLMPCPAALPVKFTVAYSQPGHQGAAYVGGFNDLGGIQYTGCASESPSPAPPPSPSPS